MDTENATQSNEMDKQKPPKTKDKRIKQWDVLIKESFDDLGEYVHYSDFKVGKLPLEIDYIMRIKQDQREKIVILIFKKYMKQ